MRTHTWRDAWLKEPLLIVAVHTDGPEHLDAALMAVGRAQADLHRGDHAQTSVKVHCFRWQEDWIVSVQVPEVTTTFARGPSPEQALRDLLADLATLSQLPETFTLGFFNEAGLLADLARRNLFLDRLGEILNDLDEQTKAQTHKASLSEPSVLDTAWNFLSAYNFSLAIGRMVGANV